MTCLSNYSSRNCVVYCDPTKVHELVEIGDIPLLTEEGWTRHQEKWCEATLLGADGVVAHKPRCGVSASRHFLLAQPPLLTEEGNVRLIHTLSHTDPKLESSPVRRY